MSFGGPAGPQPSRVYRRRRILVLLGLLAVIAVIVLIIVRPSGGATPAATGSPTPNASAPAPAPTPSAAPAADAGAIAACAPGQVQVVAVTDKGEYAPGELPQLSWTISNTGAAPCTLNVGTSQQVFTITSGRDTIWTSTDCQSAAGDAAYTLPPASTGVAPTTVTPIGWSRQRSSPGSCGDQNRPAAIGGGATYHFDVSVGGFPAAKSAQFILH